MKQLTFAGGLVLITAPGSFLNFHQFLGCDRIGIDACGFQEFFGVVDAVEFESESQPI
jgi:hypothetical protein